MHTRPFCTLYPSFSPNWTAHISPTWTQKLYLTQYQTRCATFLAHPEEAANKVQQRVSSDSIPTGPEVTSKMHLQGNIPSFDQKGQQAVTKLFGHLQDVHNHMSEVAKAVVDVSEVSSPEQFTFVLQLAVRPIIQLKFLHIYQHQQTCYLKKKDLPLKKSQKKIAAI